MAGFGSKALPSRGPMTHNLVENNKMSGEENLSKRHQSKKNKNSRPTKEHHGFYHDHPAQNPSWRLANDDVKAKKSSKHQNAPVPQTTVLRKQVDPETTKYFTEIANLFEGTGIDLEERSVICGNALEETRGKELELATDYIISHTLQTLLEGCGLDHLCGFLQSCAKEFPLIAMDRSGSHVAETAIRSLTMHLQDKEACFVIEETLTKICQVIVVNPVDVMCSCYGSHVLRSLLCICKGISSDSSEMFHITKSSTILAERLKTGAPGGKNPPHLQQGFPQLLKFLVTEMLKYARQDIATLQVDQYSSLVLQTALKLLVGEDQDLIHIIPILLGIHEENISEGHFIETTAVQYILDLLENNAYSHLMEVILEVAPETLYNEILTKIFRTSLFKISSNHCGSFVVQALVSSARYQGQMDLIWEELGGKFEELLEIGRSGVIASILAASQRLHTHGQKCCQALATAVCSKTESCSCIVPRILFLESYFCCEDKSNWKWAKGDKMHVLGCLMLQTVFRYPTEFIQAYITSITSMEAAHVLETAKDAGGGRVIESFLSSGVSAKQKRKLIVKLRGQFGELSMHPSGSFTLEKCFTASNVSLKETIASELLAVRPELSKTKQGPHLLRKLDIDGFAARPDQWRSKLESKQNAFKDFYAAFGSIETKSSKKRSVLTKFYSRPSSPPKSVKKMRKEMDRYLAPSDVVYLGSEFPGCEASVAKLSLSGSKCHQKRVGKATKLAIEEHTMKGKNELNRKRKPNGSENAAVVSKTPERGVHTRENKRQKINVV